MKRPNLNIREMLLFLIIFLISLVGFLIIIANNKLTENSRGAILTGISGKITEVQKISEQEFNTFRNVVNEGILEASGLVTIENIVSITEGHQNEFYNVVQDEIGKVGEEVGGTLDSQHQAVRMGLKQFLNDSKALMDEIIEFDNQSLAILSNMAIFNVDSLKEASSENIENFSRNIEEMDGFINLIQEKNKHDLDIFLAETIVTMDTLKGSGLLQYLVQRLGELKASSDKRKDLVRERIRKDFDQQSKVMSEVMKIVTDKVNLAISNERNNSNIMQQKKKGFDNCKTSRG